MRLILTMVLSIFISTVALASNRVTQRPSSIKTAAAHKQQRCFYLQKYNKRRQHYYYVKRCRQPRGVEEKVSAFLSSLTSDQHSALQQKLKQETAIEKSQYGITFYDPTYILPFYYTGSPARSVYTGHIPDHQTLDRQEFKAQFSFLVPLWMHILKSNYSLNVSYTQLSYWQFYAKSQYFRETNYMPALFISNNFLPNWLASLGIVHQSNGRGFPLERSWNRLFLNISFSGERWLISLKPWMLIFKSVSSDLHNPDIAHYLGKGEVVLAYKYGRQELSVMFRNAVESGFSRGAVELSYQFPLYGKLSGYVQIFSGYGQSLIEYNHYTNSAGIGVVLGNWL